MPESEAVTSVLGTELAGRKIWLVKAILETVRAGERGFVAGGISGTGNSTCLRWVPPFVAERWRSVCSESVRQGGEGPGPQLATLRWGSTSSGGGGERTLVLGHPSTSDLPQAYNLRVSTQSIAPMVAFAEEGQRIRVEGRVSQKFDLEVAARGEGGAVARAASLAGRGSASSDAFGAGAPGFHPGAPSAPVRGGAGAGPSAPGPGLLAGGGDAGSVALDPRYRALSRARLAAASAKTRTVQVLSHARITDLRQPAAAAARARLEHKAAAGSDKRLAAPAEELTGTLFGLFERQPRWAFSQLQRQTDQPTAHLKTVLMEIAAQNKRGPYKDLWELKRGYRISGSVAGVG